MKRKGETTVTEQFQSEHDRVDLMTDLIWTGIMGGQFFAARLVPDKKPHCVAGSDLRSFSSATISKPLIGGSHLFQLPLSLFPERFINNGGVGDHGIPRKPRRLMSQKTLEWGEPGH